MSIRPIAVLSLAFIAACSKPTSSTVATADTARALPPLADTAPRPAPPPPETVFVDRSRVAPPAPRPPVREEPRPDRRYPPPAERPPLREEPRPDRQYPVPLDRPAPPAPRSAIIPEGTSVSAIAIDSVHSRYTRIGDVVHVRIDQDVMQGGRVAIPAGSVVTLSVTELGGADNRGERGTLSMEAHEIQINGRSYPFAAHATDYQYEMKTRGVGAEEVAKTGAGAAIGAILGHVIGGKTGTIVGAVGGGAAGAAVAAKSADRDIVVHAGATITLQLTGDFSRREGRSPG